VRQPVSRHQLCSLKPIRICCAPGATGVLRHVPQRVILPARTMVRAISMGRAHVMALAATGQLFTWGMGLDGRLGHGDAVHRDGPTPVTGLEDAGVALMSIAAGTAHSIAADAEGTLWTWGCGLEGALGLGENDENVMTPTRVETATLAPTERPDGAGRQVRMLAAGNQSSAAVTVDGRIFTWGLGAHYTLGLGNMETVYQPTEVQSLRYAKIKKAALGPRHAAAVGEDGVLYTWGSGAHGRLGHGDGDATHRLPTPVSFFEGRKVVDVSICHCSGCATAAITEDGACFTWGAAHAPLGASDKRLPQNEGEEQDKEIDTSPQHQCVPRAVEGSWHRDRQTKIDGIALGTYHALLVTNQRVDRR
jgi:alpha-tubulin suppressor-like RCC1 family protein